MTRTLVRVFCSLVVFVPSLHPSSLRADERTRTFPAQKCRYTLPDDDWSWLEDKSPNLFMAINSKGQVVYLGSFQVSPGTELSQKYIDGWEKGLLRNPDNKKRGGRFTNFLGIPCYQSEVVKVSVDKTQVGRVFLAHGFLYNL